MRSKFDEQLELLHKELIKMGTLCENAISRSAKALTEGKIQFASEVLMFTSEINEKERDIEAMCMKLLLQQQPVAKDLRIISSAMKMVTDMERIGDNSGDIAEIVSMGYLKNYDNSFPIRDMAQATIKMVNDSIDSFVNQDIDLAKKTILSDDIVDNYFDQMKTRLIEQIGRSEIDAEESIDLLMIAKYLERIGDHAVEISKWVLFSITGNREP